MRENILTVAASIAGANEDDWTLLEELCRAAEAAWMARLREGVSMENCGSAFDCAVAFSAAAMFGAGQEGVSSFSAGDVSVKLRGEAGASLREAAERLMAPYARPEGLFLKGVPG